MWMTWPNNKPSTVPGDDANRWIMEAKVGPDIAILCRGRSSMALLLRGLTQTQREGDNKD